MLWHGVERRSRCSLFTAVLAFSQLVGLVSAIISTISLFSRTRLDPVTLSIHTLETRSPADNTTFGAGLTSAALSENKQAYYTVIQVGGINFRVALDTASSDLWLVSSACTTDKCEMVPSYPLTYDSPTFIPLDDNTTIFSAHYADDSFASGFFARETVGITNLTLPNQTFALVTNTNVSLTDMTSGIMGLGFPRLSSFPMRKEGALPFFAKLAAYGLLEYPLFAFSLTRNSSGTLTLGAIDASVVVNPALISWNPVAQFPPFTSESNTSSYLEWAIPITAFAVNQTSFTPIPTYSRPSLALFDIGTPGIYGPYQDVTRFFGALNGARLVDSSGQWAVPCDTMVPISFTFGTKIFHMLPTDYLRGPASGNPNLCLSWLMSLPPNSDGVDWQFGTAFLRTVYSIFSFGVNEKEPPMIGLYPLRNNTNTTTQIQSPSEISSFFSANSATISTRLPNFLLSTPTFTTPSYAFNTSVTTVLGGIVATGLANTTYSPLFGQTTVLENISALPTIFPPPSVVTITTTESGRVSTTTKTYLSPSITLGMPQLSSAATRWLVTLELGLIITTVGVVSWMLTLS